MTISTDLWTYLDNAVANVDFALTMAAPDARAPLVEITLSYHERTRTTGSTSANYITTFEIECWDKTTVLAASLCATVSALLQDKSGLMGSTYLFRSRIYNEFSGSDSSAELFNRSFSVSFTHR
jgi:hypothetical protein